MLSRDNCCFFIVNFANFLLAVAKPVFFVLWVLKEQTILILQIGGCPWLCPKTQRQAEIS